MTQPRADAVKCRTPGCVREMAKYRGGFCHACSRAHQRQKEGDRRPRCRYCDALLSMVRHDGTVCLAVRCQAEKAGI